VVYVLKKYTKNNLTWQYLCNAIHCAREAQDEEGKMKAKEARKIINLNIPDAPDK
jgi:hypothetical protein